jgi:hypothetical protein
MISAIYNLYPQVVTINGDIAYDANGNEVTYDLQAVNAKALELQAAETAKQEAAVTSKASALAKLAALGLTQDEVKALIG